MKKITLPLFTLLSISSIVSAQSIDDGRKLLNYEKLTSARQAFQKITASDPKNAQAIYWLGQVYITQDKLDSAKLLYQNALNGGLNVGCAAAKTAAHTTSSSLSPALPIRSPSNWN